jgi:hypothetical protein
MGSAVGTKSRESIFGPSIRASAERAAAARKEADRLACEAWNTRNDLRQTQQGAVTSFRLSEEDTPSWKLARHQSLFRGALLMCNL